MIHLTYSNRTEALFDRFAEDLHAWRSAPGQHLFDAARLVVPNRNVETWLKRALAARDGLAANFEVLLLRRFVSGLVRDHDPGLRLVDSELIQDLLLSVLLDPARIRHPELAEVRRYLEGGGRSADAMDQRRVQLSAQLSRLFEEYGFSRPKMLEQWPRGMALPEGRWTPREVWQRRLWLEVFGPDALLDRRAAESGTRYRTLSQVVSELGDGALAGDRPIFLFGVSYVAEAYQQVLGRIAARGELYVYTLNPCMEFWEDLQTPRERARLEGLPRRGKKVDPASLEGEDPFGLRAQGDPPALVLWGRPGRENVRLLDQLSNCDFHPAFSSPPSPLPGPLSGKLEGGGCSLLNQLQRDILVREPERTSPDPDFQFEHDQSIRLLACPGIRRQAEAIAQEIWALVQADAKRGGDPAKRLRFSDVAVMVAGHAPESYFTHLASAFDERGFEIPYTLEATALASQSRVAEAAVRLLELPFGRFTRAEVLGVVTHPAVASRFPDADPQEWVRWCDALGIFHGANQDDLKGSYLDRDLHNWDQGLRRLALGAVMSSPAGGKAFVLGDERYLPEEHTESAEGNAAALGRLVRSLLADAGFLRGQKLAMQDWADLLGQVLSTYLVPQNESERHDLDKCLAAVRGLAELTLDGKEVGYRIAGALARTALAGLTRSVSRHLDEGVTLSTLQPMRALPFKVVFVAGLDEGRFPAADRKNELDLRPARPRAGDVSPREQDQYMFLETLLCARERLVLSYLARNETTGDPLEPSPVVIELLRMLERGYLPDARKKLVREVPLRRFDEAEVEGLPSPPEARFEARLRTLRRTVDDKLGAQPLDRHRLHDLLPEPAAVELEEHLRLCSIPGGAEPEAAGEPETPDGLGPLDRLGVKGAAPLRVRLSDLKKFLQCPVQGAARYVLRLEEDEEDRSIVEDEPFEAGTLSRLAGQRHVFLEWVRSKGAAQFAELAQEWSAPLIAAGALPAGWLWDLEKDSLLTGPKVWQALFEKIGTAQGVATHGFGSVAEEERVDALHAPIVLTLSDGRTVELVGTTGPLLVEPQREIGGTELAVFQRNRESEKYGLETARRKHDSLGAFLDHVALCAAGLRGQASISLQLYDHPSGGQAEHHQFQPVEPQEARKYLATLVEDLLVVGELQLPAVAVFHWCAAQKAAESAARKGARKWVGSFADSLDTIIERKGYLASRYGPVRGVEGFPVPDDAKAQELIDRRFGLYLRIAEKIDDYAGGEGGGS